MTFDNISVLRQMNSFLEDLYYMSYFVEPEPVVKNSPLHSPQNKSDRTKHNYNNMHAHFSYITIYLPTHQLTSSLRTFCASVSTSYLLRLYFVHFIVNDAFMVITFVVQCV